MFPSPSKAICLSQQQVKTPTTNESNSCLSKTHPFFHLPTVIIPVSAWAFIPPQAETLTEFRKEILTFHHEGFFWRCWFFGKGHSETIWSFWYSEYDATTPYPQRSLSLNCREVQERAPRDGEIVVYISLFSFSSSLPDEGCSEAPFDADWWPMCNET